MRGLCTRRVAVGACGLLAAVGVATAGAPDWTLVSDQTVVSTSSEFLIRSLRRVVLNDDETRMYASFLQKADGAGIKEYTLAGDPPVATEIGYFNVTLVGASGNLHQPEGLDVDDRGFVFVGSSKDSTSQDNARIIILPPGLGTHQYFGLADIDFVGNTGETIGDVRIRNVAGTYQLYVSRLRAGSAYVERYIVGGSSIGSFTLTLDTAFSGDGRFNLRTEGGFASASGLRGIDIAPDGTIYVVSRDDNLMYKISADLTTVTTVALSNPMGVALYDDRAFVTQYNGNTSSIAEVDQSTLSILSTFDAFDDFPRDPGSDGNQAGYAGICVDAAGHLFVGDQLYFRSSAESRDRVVRSSSFAPPPPPVLSLESSGACPDDWDNNAGNGYQVAIELWMRDLSSDVTGFQAFLLYDNVTLTYNGSLSTYTNSPFPLHITPIAAADVGGGSMWLDGSVFFGNPGVTADSLLATLVFDVNTECATTDVTFDTTFVFDSELSYQGVPIVTDLSNSPAITLDDTPPVLDPCPNVTVPAGAEFGSGCDSATVVYVLPGATDNCSSADVVADIPSGSVFPVGTTPVTVTATDACGNSSQCMFDVIVTPTNLIEVDVELVGVFTPVSRCIHFVMDECDATADATLSFVDHDGDDANSNGTVDATEGGSNTPATPVRAVAQIVEVPCGPWTQLCAKDEQHTLWDTVNLALSGSVYVTTSLISLEPGDNDNDGDVDINDVTFVIANFGGPEAAVGCPWDGTRGTDFSNNGNVGSEDYSLLSSNWLSLTSCVCATPFPMPSSFNAQKSIPVSAMGARMAARVDLNRDGVFDYRDMKLFEQRHHLHTDLSTKLAPSAPDAGESSSIKKK